MFKYFQDLATQLVETVAVFGISEIGDVGALVIGLVRALIPG